MERFLHITIIACLLCANLYGQDTGYGPSYQTMLAGNPALAGAEGDGTLRLSYLNFYPGKGYNLNSFFVSYDSYIPAAHGGGGFWLSNDIQGSIINDLRGGLSYAYFLRAGQDLYISAGLSAGIFHRSFTFGSAILPDMIDPFGGAILPPGETLLDRNRTVFDIGAGFLLMYGNFTWGIAVSHLSQPDISDRDDQLTRKLILHGAYRFILAPESELAVTPAFYGEIQGDNYTAAIGASVGTDKISVSSIFFSNSNNNINFQPGFSFGAGRIGFFYNYRMNLIRGNNLLPVSLQHQTGLAFSLYNVDKRNLLKTISLPKM